MARNSFSFLDVIQRQSSEREYVFDYKNRAPIGYNHKKCKWTRDHPARRKFQLPAEQKEEEYQMTGIPMKSEAEPEALKRRGKRS